VAVIQSRIAAAISAPMFLFDQARDADPAGSLPQMRDNAYVHRCRK
jgi:hypothetical protein